MALKDKIFLKTVFLVMKIAAAVIMLTLAPGLPCGQNIAMMIGYGLGVIPMMLSEIVELWQELH